MTSNRPPDDWYATFPDPVVGGAILDRLVSSAIKILTTAGRSYRREVMGSRPTRHIRPRSVKTTVIRTIRRARIAVTAFSSARWYPNTPQTKPRAGLRGG